MFPQASFLLFLKVDEEKNTTSEKLRRQLEEVYKCTLYVEVIFWLKM